MVLLTGKQFEFRIAYAALLVAGKTAGAALEYVSIYRFPVDPDKVVSNDPNKANGVAWVEFWDSTMDAEWDLLGAISEDEEFRLEGRLLAVMPGSEPAQEEALINRAKAIMAQIETITRANVKMPTMPSKVRDVILTTIQTQPFYTDSGIALIVPFTVRVRSQIREF